MLISLDLCQGLESSVVASRDSLPEFFRAASCTCIMQSAERLRPYFFAGLNVIPSPTPQSLSRRCGSVFANPKPYTLNPNL